MRTVKKTIDIEVPFGAFVSFKPEYNGDQLICVHPAFIILTAQDISVMGKLMDGGGIEPSLIFTASLLNQKQEFELGKYRECKESGKTYTFKTLAAGGKPTYWMPHFYFETFLLAQEFVADLNDAIADNPESYNLAAERAAMEDFLKEEPHHYE